MRNKGESVSDKSFAEITGEQMLLTEWEWQLNMASLPKSEFLNRLANTGDKFAKLNVDKNYICPEKVLTISKPKGDDRLVFVTYTKLPNGFTTGFTTGTVSFLKYKDLIDRMFALNKHNGKKI